MKFKNALKTFLIGLFASSCVTTSIVFSNKTSDAFALEENSLFAQGTNSVYAGGTGNLSVYCDSFESIRTIAFEVHSSDGIIINSATCSYNAAIRDANYTTSSATCSYVFSEDTFLNSDRLLYITYNLESSLSVSRLSFDILVTEAYNGNGESINISGFRYNIDVLEKVPEYKAFIHSTSSKTETKIQDTFTISFDIDRTSASKIRSGFFEVTYDDEYFEIDNYSLNGFFEDKLYDLNINNNVISISFISSQTNSNTSLFSITFVSIKNVDVHSKISLNTKELLDAQYNNYLCSPVNAYITNLFDSEYKGNIPCVKLSNVIDKASEMVNIKVSIDAESYLGAADFILSFDPQSFEYNNSIKLSSFSFFTINEKEASLGILKFSIISLSDVLDARNILSMSLKCKHDNNSNGEINISASGISDSLTNPIQLKFLNTVVDLDNAFEFSDWSITSEATCAHEGEKQSKCLNCDYVKTEIIDKLPHTEVIDPEVPATCSSSGLTAGSHCSVCGQVIVDQKIIPIPSKNAKVSPTFFESSFGESENNHYEYCTDENEGTSFSAIASGKNENYIIFIVPNNINYSGFKLIFSIYSGIAISVSKDNISYYEAYETDSKGSTIDVNINFPLSTFKFVKVSSKILSGYSFFFDITEFALKTQLSYDELGHSYVHYPYHAPTCNEEGYEEHYECSICGKLFNTDYEIVDQASIAIDSLEHVPGEYGVTKAPNFYEDGVETTHCTLCGETITRVMPSHYDEQLAPIIDKLGYHSNGEISWNGLDTRNDGTTCNETFFEVRTMLLALPEDKISLFIYSNDSIISQARNRYEEWARVLSEHAYDFGKETMNKTITFDRIDDSSRIALIISSLCLLGFGYLLSQKARNALKNKKQ